MHSPQTLTSPPPSSRTAPVTSWLQFLPGSSSACVPQKPGVRQVRAQFSFSSLLHAPVSGSHLSSVQSLLSSQRALLSVLTQPSTGSQVSSVQPLSSSQFRAPGSLEQPLTGSQMSVVQTSLSSQVSRSLCRQPSTGSHVSSVQTSKRSEERRVGKEWS